MSNSTTSAKCKIVGKASMPTGEKLLHVIGDKGRDYQLRLENSNAGSRFYIGQKTTIILENEVPVMLDMEKIKRIIADNSKRLPLKHLTLDNFED